MIHINQLMYAVIYKVAITNSVQEEFERISTWFQEYPPSQSMWCSFNNHAVHAEMPGVSVGGKAIQREQKAAISGICFCQSIIWKRPHHKKCVQDKKGVHGCKNDGLCKHVILYQSLVLSVIDYGLVLVNISDTQLNRME